MKNVILICEDVAHRNFITAALREIGVKNLCHRLDNWVASSRLTGGNLNSVIARVKDSEYENWRAQCKLCKILLIVVADADDRTIEQRRTDFPYGNEYQELYVVVIPKRNIETWVELGLSLTKGTSIDDCTDYKTARTQNPKNVKDAVKHLFNCLNNEGLNQNHSASHVWSAFALAMNDLKRGCKALDGK